MIVMFNMFDQKPLSGPWERYFCFFFLFVRHFLFFFYDFIANTCLPSKGYLYKSESFICKNDLTLTWHKSGGIYRRMDNCTVQSTVYLKAPVFRGFDYQHCIKPLDPDGRTIEMQPNQTFVAVLFMCSLTVLSLYYVLIRKHRKKR